MKKEPLEAETALHPHPVWPGAGLNVQLAVDSGMVVEHLVVPPRLPWENLKACVGSTHLAGNVDDGTMHVCLVMVPFIHVSAHSMCTKSGKGRDVALPPES